MKHLDCSHSSNRVHENSVGTLKKVPILLIPGNTADQRNQSGIKRESSKFILRRLHRIMMRKFLLVVLNPLVPAHMFLDGGDMMLKVKVRRIRINQELMVYLPPLTRIPMSLRLANFRLRSKNSSSWTWARSSEGVKPTGDEESAGLRSGKDLPQRDSSEESERLIAVASSHTGRLEGRTLQGDEWVEVRVDRRAEVQLEPVFCLTGAGLRDLSEDEAGMIFSVTPPMPSSSRSFFSRLGFKSSSQKPKKQKKGKKESDSSDSSSSSEDEKNQIQVIPVEVCMNFFSTFLDVFRSLNFMYICNDLVVGRTALERSYFNFSAVLFA
ncbi:hypothetical protein COOONC_22554 [Cooperia oncophora]